jgi:hypothetical protein
MGVTLEEQQNESTQTLFNKNIRQKYFRYLSINQVL